MEVKDKLEEAIEARNAFVLDGALKQATDMGFQDAKLLKNARDLLEIVKREVQLDELLTAAIASVRYAK